MGGDSYARSVRLRRNAAGLTQRQLAGLAGVKQPLIAAIESGARKPTASVRQALDNALRVPPSKLLALLTDEVLDAVSRSGARNARVFGSIARGEDRPGSGVDILVSFPAGSDIVTLLDLEAELSDLLTVPVDVVSDSGNSRVLDRALAEAVSL